MSALRESTSGRAAVRARHADAGVVAQMARSLHREASSERARPSVRASSRNREIACAAEATRRLRGSSQGRSRGASAAQPRRAALTA